jgi:hypothetical protein
MDRETEPQAESESGPKGFSRGWQRNAPGAGEEAGNLESTARQRRLEPPPFVAVKWVQAKGRESLACGERIVRDWSSDHQGSFIARERITSDPADHGLRCEPGSRLEKDIREVEESLELDARS